MIMACLKERTKTLHQRTEQVIDVSRRLGNLRGYTDLLCRFYGIYCGLESAIRPVVAHAVPGLNFNERSKPELILHDLQQLGVSTLSIRSLAVCDVVPNIQTPAQALGCMYVMEGATLGGQVLLRQVTPEWGLTADRGAAFLTGYGERTSVMWREFGQAVTDFVVCNPGCESELIEAATATFSCFEKWMAC